MELGYRESTESWAYVLRGLRERGMSAPLLAVGDGARRMKRRDSALYLVYKVVLRLGERWRPLYGGRNLMSLLVDGARFEDGVLVELPPSEETARAA